MSRLVEPIKSGVTAPSAADDENGVERIAKYIPAEILAFYTMWTQAASMLPVESKDSGAELPDGIMFLGNTITMVCAGGLLIGVLITYIYFDRFFPETPTESQKYHRIISPIAFAIYGYTIWGAVDSTCFEPAIALMATAMLTLVSFLAQPKSPPDPAE